ncbi:MAG: CinA family protein, partial [Akkermansiaceae bacterium]|nr:CinA family protein [Armatimonadota bacterium]
TDAKPVGLVHIGLATPDKTVSIECRFSGNRADIRYRATQAALDLLRRDLLATPPEP